MVSLNTPAAKLRYTPLTLRRLIFYYRMDFLCRPLRTGALVYMGRWDSIYEKCAICYFDLFMDVRSWYITNTKWNFLKCFMISPLSWSNGGLWFAIQGSSQSQTLQCEGYFLSFVSIHFMLTHKLFSHIICKVRPPCCCKSHPFPLLAIRMHHTVWTSHFLRNPTQKPLSTWSFLCCPLLTMWYFSAFLWCFFVSN